MQTTADAVFQQVNDAEKEYWSSLAVQYRQFQEEIAEMDQRAFLSDAINKGLAQGIQEGIQQGIQQGLTQGLQQGRAEGEARGRTEGRAEGLAEGEARGRTEGAMSAYFSLVNDGILSSADAARRLGMTEEEFEIRRRAALN